MDISCSKCAWAEYCKGKENKYCKDNSYIFFTSKEDKELCDLMCGGNEDE